MAKKTKKLVLWIFDYKDSFNLIQDFISKDVVLNKFSSVDEYKLFKKTQERQSQNFQYPDFVLFFPRISSYRVIEISAVVKVLNEIKSNDPKTILIAFCGVPKIKEQLAKKGFEVENFSGGESVRDLLSVPKPKI